MPRTLVSIALALMTINPVFSDGPNDPENAAANHFAQRTCVYMMYGFALGKGMSPSEALASVTKDPTAFRICVEQQQAQIKQELHKDGVVMEFKILVES